MFEAGMDLIASLLACQDGYTTTNRRIKTGCIYNVSELLQLFYDFMIGNETLNMRQPHYSFTGDRNRILIIILLP